MELGTKKFFMKGIFKKEKIKISQEELIKAKNKFFKAGNKITQLPPDKSAGSLNIPEDRRCISHGYYRHIRHIPEGSKDWLLIN